MDIRLQAAIACGIVYLAAIIGVPVMKRVDPDNHWYLPYVIVVCILLTLFVIAYVFSELEH